MKSINFSQDIWGGFFDSGDPNSHFQSININYNLPLEYFPILSFIDSNYSYSGNFSWDSGSNILDNVTSSDGRVLGSINTIQNSNSKVLNGSLSFERLFKNLGFKFKNPKLIYIALTHKSHPSSGENNQRLEFLGDSILSAVITEYLYEKFKHKIGKYRSPIGYAQWDWVNNWLLQFQAEPMLMDLACLLYTSPSPRDVEESRMPSSA